MSAGWQVTLCDSIWHVSSRSGVAMLHCELLYLLPLPFTFTYSIATHLTGDRTGIYRSVGGVLISLLQQLNSHGGYSTKKVSK